MNAIYQNIAQLCTNTSALECYRNVGPSKRGHFALNITDIEPEHYEFFLTNCERTQLVLYLHMVLLNSDGEHLSTHEIPLLSIRASFLLFWALLTIAWMLQWAVSDVRAPALHHVLSAVPHLKLLALGASIWRWLELSERGFVPDHIEILNYLFTFLFNSAFYAAILLVSRGWTVTVLSIPSQELRAYGVTVLGLALAALFYELIGRYYFFAFLVMGVIYLRFALSNVQTNVHELKAALRAIRHHPGTTLEFLLRAKIAAMKLFNRLLVSYAFGMGASLILVTFFFGSVTWIDSNKDWLVMLLLEGLLIGFFAGTAWVFRLRRISPEPQPGAPPPLKNVRIPSAFCLYLPAFPDVQSFQECG